MTAARKLRFADADPTAWISSLQKALSESTLEAMALGSSSGVQETVRKWLAHAHAADSPNALEDLFAEASVLSLELSLSLIHI